MFAQPFSSNPQSLAVWFFEAGYRPERLADGTRRAPVHINASPKI
jgi:hypothetical protein